MYTIRQAEHDSPFFATDTVCLNSQTDPENSVEQDGSSRPGSMKVAEKEDVYQLGKILLQIIIGKLLKSTSELDEQRLMVHS